MSSIEKQTNKDLGLTIKILLPMLVITLAVYGYDYLKKTKVQVSQKKIEETAWVVDTETINFSNHQPMLKLYGEAVSGRTVELRSLVAGKIIKVGDKLSNGGIVKKNELLLQIDPFKYKGALTEAESRLAEAKARLQEIKANLAQEEQNLKYLIEQLSLANKDLKRAIQLANKGTATKKLEDDRRVIVSQRSQSVAQKKSSLEVFKSRHDQQLAIIKRLEWGVQDAKRNLKDTTLRSPFDAYVSQVNAEVGRTVSANDRIATLFKTTTIDIRFNLSDTQYGRIIGSGETVPGRNILVNWHVSTPPIQYKAKIERVSSRISSDSGGIEIIARLLNPLSKSPIRPGTFVEVLVPDKLYKTVARVPQSVLFEGKYVYVVVNSRLQKRKVKSHGIDGNYILLTGDIKQNELVIKTRLSTVGEGLLVKPNKEQPAKSNRQTVGEKSPAKTVQTLSEISKDKQPQ